LSSLSSSGFSFFFPPLTRTGISVFPLRHIDLLSEFNSSLSDFLTASIIFEASAVKALILLHFNIASMGI